MSVLSKLQEGMVNRDLQKEGHRMLKKWAKTGLLEGLETEHQRHNMARLLENQTRELLREASSMAAGDVEGFASVAFPIVRRVFGSLIANDLVSVQPMSLPAGLIFFLDFQINGARLGYEANDSLYGGGVVGQEITGGVSLSGDNAEESFYAMNNGYSSPTGSTAITYTVIDSGTVGADDNVLNRTCRYDADLSGTAVCVARFTASGLDQFAERNMVTLTMAGLVGSQVRRLSHYSGSAKTHINVVVRATGSETAADLATAVNGLSFTTTYAIVDDLIGTPSAGATNALGAIVGTDSWGLEAESAIPEIDIKVDSVSVTAETKKLKAKWTPELGQDLNAFHNMDAEVELTSILSEHIALEIDRRIIEDLIKGATASTYYWSRKPGKFVNRATGLSVNAALFPDFTGNVSEWYETLIETINDVSAQMHRKLLRGGATDVVTSPEVANILEFTSGFRAAVTADDSKGTIGTYKSGSISKKWDVWVDPYFPRNLILVVRKGSSFLESGYVYAPYVPLQVSPTVFGPEDFVPRKAIMSRAAFKMVRPDHYGLVVVQDLLG